jgi:hypothetical protein
MKSVKISIAVASSKVKARKRDETGKCTTTQGTVRSL